MGTYKSVLPAACLLVLGSCGSAAHAQFGYTATPGFTATGRHAENAVRAPATYGAIGLYPAAPFNSGGTFNGGISGTRTNMGGLVYGTIGFQSPKGKKETELGAWVWATGKTDLYQFEVRRYIGPEVALQLSKIQSTKAEGEGYSAFAIYTLDSSRVAPTSPRAFGVQVAPGIFYDTSGAAKTYSFTTFVQGSYEIGKNITLNASEWYVRDRGVDLTRFALGVGIGF